MFKKLGKKASLTADVLHKPDMVLTDYSHWLILIAAVAEAKVEFQGKHLTTALHPLLDTNVIVAQELLKC